jgi:DNA repair protein RecO (recombination protein O)
MVPFQTLSPPLPPPHPLCATWSTTVSQEKTEALVMRGVDFSETSRVVTFLTPGRGQVTCIAKGARRRNSALASVLDNLNSVELVYSWKDGRQVQTLVEASLLDGFAAIKNNFEKWTYAALPVELAGRLAHENEPSAGLYEALLRGLKSLAAWEGDVAAHTAWQLLQLLGAGGFDPSWDHCGHCGVEIVGRTAFSFDSGVVCAGCGGDRALSEGAHGLLGRLRAGATACPVVAGEGGGEVFHLLRQFAARQVEADLRSARVIVELFAPGSPQERPGQRKEI